MSCRFCGAPLSLSLIDLGATPLANSYLPDTAEAVAAERRYPLHAMVCEACWLVQLDHDAPADAIFDHDYAYLSSYSDSWVAHAARYATEMTARFGLGAGSLVVEVASNDGYLLQHFVGAGVPVLGVEPAGHAASLAVARGVPTRVAFFNAATATALRAEGVRADLMAANNVLAHVPDIRDFVAGFAVLLAPQGVVTFEFPHLQTQLAGLQFDTIYHEHYSYLSLVAVERILAAVGLEVFDVARLSTHGGSLRVFAGHAGAHAPCPGLAEVRAGELAAGLLAPATYRDFAPMVRAFTGRVSAALRAERGRVMAYGAAAKGNTFLNYCGLGRETFQAVADRNPQKQGRLLPGSHIPVISPEGLIAARPDLVVILPWNLRAEIAASLPGLRLAVVDPGAAEGLAFL